jgi:hypothetical protein
VHDEPLLRALHIGAEPDNDFLSWDSTVGAAYQHYRGFIRPHYSMVLSAKKKSPQWSYLDFVGDPEVLAGAPLLCLLPPWARGSLTNLLLGRLGRRSLQRAKFGHSTRPVVYDPIDIPSPTCWLLARFGAAAIARHSVAIHDLNAVRGSGMAAGSPRLGCRHRQARSLE